MGALPTIDLIDLGAEPNVGIGQADDLRDGGAKINDNFTALRNRSILSFPDMPDGWGTAGQLLATNGEEMYWTNLSGSGLESIYSADGALADNRTIAGGGNSLTLSGLTAFTVGCTSMSILSTLSAGVSAGSETSTNALGLGLNGAVQVRVEAPYTCFTFQGNGGALLGDRCSAIGVLNGTTSDFAYVRAIHTGAQVEADIVASDFGTAVTQFHFTPTTAWLNVANARVWDYSATASVTARDVEITDTTKGLIIRDTNGQRYRVTINTSGALVTTAL